MASVSHKWTSFEVRTLLCLIIKGEHHGSDPIDVADKLNTALNGPEPPTKKRKKRGAATDTIVVAKTNYDRDIPVADVQAMLARILAKKKHAVDLCARDPSRLVTTKKMRALTRQGLDFGGGDDEWRAGGRREEAAAAAAAERARRSRRCGGYPDEDKDESNRRREMVESPRARMLLVDWGMGASFWEDKPVQRGDATPPSDKEPEQPCQYQTPPSSGSRGAANPK